jgi:2-keto-4-pentenoate hydratase/2-oxohepta-3-ene-1,7-dioic acid hydratase in catechol pathway
VKIVRFASASGSTYGILEGDRVQPIEGQPYDGIRRVGAAVELAGLRLLAPTDPSKVIAIANNYLSHVVPDGEPIPDHPEPFYKVPTAVIGPGDDIVIPPGGTRVEAEAEMVVVISKLARRIDESESRAHILGVTSGNDVSERVWQRGDIQWWRGKSADTFAPFGPWIETDADYRDLALICRVNGTVVQEQRTRDLLFGVDRIVSFISHYVTLLPGDVIFTGTPGSASQLVPGDSVEVEVEGVGVLRNPVRAG